MGRPPSPRRFQPSFNAAESRRALLRFHLDTGGRLTTKTFPTDIEVESSCGLAIYSSRA
jgi:hypothetical protein